MGFEHLKRRVVNIPAGHAATALVLRLSAPLYELIDIHAVKTRSLPPVTKALPKVTHSLDITEHDTDCAAWMTRKAGSQFISASLANLRRVRVSSGRAGHSCGTKHISGLWLEYSDDSGDAIVGQWLNEIGYFTLEPDECLVGLVIRGTQSVRLVEATAQAEIQLPWKGIRISGLEFQTSTGRHLQFQQGSDNASVKKQINLSYCATPYEELGSIIWASNVMADDVQVGFIPSRLLGTGRLLLCEAAYSVRHPCLFLQNTRSFYSYDGSESDTINPVDKSGVYGAMRRYYHASETFLWHERHTGELTQMQKLEFVFDTATQVVRGIKCTYEGGFVKHFGFTTGLENVIVYTLDLSQDKNEKVTLLVSRRISGTNYGIELHTSAGQVCRAMPESTDDYEVDSYAMVPGAKPPKISGETQWKKTHWSFPDANPTSQKVSQSVGIWVSGHRVQRADSNGSVVEMPYLDAFGPMYVTDPSTKTSRSSFGLSFKEKIHNTTRKDNWVFK
jgi:hypothetical protein